MRIKIKDNAKDLYVNTTILNRGLVNWEYADMLEAIQGSTIEVETDYLFQDSFNTVPIKGVSDNGMRILARSVDEVIDDKRIGRMFCVWCHNHSEVGPECANCGEGGYLRRFDMSQHNIVAHMVKVSPVEEY